MKVKSFAASRHKTLDCLLKHSIMDDFKPNLAFVFSSIQMDLEVVGETFKAYPLQVFGMSTCGEIFYDGKEEGIWINSTAVSLVEIDQSCFSTKTFDGHDITSADLGREIGKWGKSKFENPAFIIGICGLTTNGQAVVEGVQEICGKETTLFGGLAGDDARFEETFVFDENRILDLGAVVTVFDTQKTDIKGLATSGWVGIGSDKLITSAEGNVVYTIDDIPALKVYKDHLNIRDEDLPEIGVEYPLLVKKENREILRAVIGIDREKESLIFAGTVPEGATVTFSTSPGFEVVDHTKQDISDFFDRHGTGSLLLLFSCMARHKALGPIINEELERTWEKARVPITGFFTYGEIGNNKFSECEFYNETFTLAVISEKKQG
ncbi:MAG: FIST signal transduction protein [Bacteroidales bacterium]